MSRIVALDLTSPGRVVTWFVTGLWISFQQRCAVFNPEAGGRRLASTDEGDVPRPEIRDARRVALARVRSAFARLDHASGNVLTQVSGGRRAGTVRVVTIGPASQAQASSPAAGHLPAAKLAALQKAMTDHALATGFSKGYMVSAGIALLSLIITAVAIRVRREDLSGVNPMAGLGG